MKKVKLSSLFTINNETVEILDPEQMKKFCGGDGTTRGGNDATGGPPDINGITATVSPLSSVKI